MFTVIDCGTTNTRIHVVNEKEQIIASGEAHVGTRDTSITGSKEKLKQGLDALYTQVLAEAGLKREEMDFAIASGMITSNIGLVDLPHLTAPIGLNELTDGIVRFEDGEILSLGCPVYFVRGVKNYETAEFTADSLRQTDFMRGEEVQVMGILKELKLPTPCNIVVLSSHTKNIYVDELGRITASSTTMSGQIYAALLQATFLESSVIPQEGEVRRHSLEEIMELAEACNEHAGLGRSLVMARFMQVLMDSHGDERRTFVEALIASDDLKSFREMREQGFESGTYVLFGQKERCEMYEKLLHRHFGEHLDIRLVTDKAEISRMTVSGAIAVAMNYISSNAKTREL